MGQQSLTALSVRDAAPAGGSPSFVALDLPPRIIGSASRKPQPIPQPSADFQNLVNQVVYLARTLLGANGSAIAFRQGQGTICSARSGEGAPPLGAPVDISSGISRECLDSGTPLWCEDVAAVDPQISQAAGIRAVAVAPIFCGDQISGILAVFSFVPRVFTQLHLKWLQQLASWVGSAQSIRTEKIFPARVADSYPPLHLLNDVFIETRLPWKRFIESVLLHIVAIGIVVALSAFWPQVPLIASHPLRDAHITYYPFSQSFPASESSRPPAPPRRRHVSARQQPAASGGADRKPATRDAVSARKLDEPTLPPGMPAFTNSRIPGSAVIAAVSPAPELGEAASRRLSLSRNSIVAPPPELGGGSGVRRFNAPKAAVIPPSPELPGSSNVSARGMRNPGGISSGHGADNLIVPPAPSVDDRALITNGASGLAPGQRVISAPPTLENGVGPGGKGRTVSLAGGGSQVLPPPASLDGSGNSLGIGRGHFTGAGAGDARVVPPAPSFEDARNLAGGRGSSLAATGNGPQVVPPAPSFEDARNHGGARGGSLGATGNGPQVVAPAPSMQEAGNLGGGRGIGSLGRGTSEAVGPPPSDAALGGSGRGGRATSLSGSPGEAALAPEAKADIPSADRGTAAKPLVRGPDLDLSHRVFQDMQLRVIGLAWAPPRSSYFSSFEVFIAEKAVNKTQSQLIKLVYVFLPYQRRLSQYGADALRTRRLRVTRDSSCDENMMEMMWPEGEDHPTGSRSSAPPPSTTRNDLLPCYITTADDYVRAFSRTR